MRDKGKVDGISTQMEKIIKGLEGNRNQPMAGQKVWRRFMGFCEQRK